LRLSENRALRRIFGPKREEVAGDWRRLHNEELHDLHLSSNVITVIKSRRMRWAWHVARMGEVHTKFWLENPKGREHSEKVCTDDVRIILEWISGWEGVD
jgi:PAS domain-containing protein